MRRIPSRLRAYVRDLLIGVGYLILSFGLLLGIGLLPILPVIGGH